MLETDTPGALAACNALLAQGHEPRVVATGHGAAVETIRLMHAAQARLAPMDIIHADNPKKGDTTRGKLLWANEDIRTATVACLVDSVFLLADLWTSAWNEGDGDSIDNSELVEFDEDDLNNICRHEAEFVPSLSLAAMAESGEFEPE